MKNGLNTMLKTDARRMFHTSRFYIFLAASLVMPVLILVMTTAFGGQAVMGPAAYEAASAAVFSNAWQIIGTESGDGMGMAMDITGMCNINLVYFMAGLLLCLFVSDEFRSGYSKNLFAVRAEKRSYVVSKTVIGFIAGTLMLAAFFAGSVIGGKTAGLSFELGSLSAANVAMCMLAKIFLMNVFASIFLLFSVIGKQRAWLSICLSLFGGMLLFMMIPLMTPLNSGILNVGMCLAGGIIFAVWTGAGSNWILKKTSLV